MPDWKLILMHRRWKAWVGAGLVLVVAMEVVGGPWPAFTANTGGRLELVVNSAGDEPLATVPTARIPVAYSYISQGFWALHPGIDMASQIGVPIHPMMAGLVVKAERDWFGYGNLVVVKHTDGYESWYAHLSRIDVQTGTEVTTDSVLGLVGVTGRSTGPHLHLELHYNDEPIDPRPILGIK